MAGGVGWEEGEARKGCSSPRILKRCWVEAHTHVPMGKPSGAAPKTFPFRVPRVLCGGDAAARRPLSLRGREIGQRAAGGLDATALAVTCRGHTSAAQWWLPAAPLPALLFPPSI